MHETLITEEESKLAFENDEMIVIPSSRNIDYIKTKGFEILSIGKITSDNNNFLSIKEIMEMI